jgi:uncharacterized protein (DUF488 family)
VRQPYFTIGHSTLELDAFVALLQGAQIALLADIRTVPRSRTNPQFNTETLPASLAAFQIGYEHMPALGGLRRKSRTVPAAVNGFWINQSFHNFADYAMTDAFRDGLAELRERGRERRCAIMCSEAVWWRCHRRIVADYLLAAGETVFHIMGNGRVEPARLTPGAGIQPDRSIAYPPPGHQPEEPAA